MNVPLWIWAAVLAFIVVMLAVDLFAHRRAHVIGVREAASWSAVRVVIRQRHEHLDPERSGVLRAFRRFVPMTEAYHGQKLLVSRDGMLLATPLLAVLVLIWVGIKMLLKIDIFYIPTTFSLAVVAAIITISIVASLRATRGQGRVALPVPTDPPFRVATEAENAALEPVWASRGRSTPSTR